MNTLFLIPGTWDLAVDISGNIAVAADPYASAQNAATAIQTFLGEVWYDTTQGLPYWQSILGMYPPLALVKSQMVAAAEAVPNIQSAQVFISGAGLNRQITGQVQVTTVDGQTAIAGF